MKFVLLLLVLIFSFSSFAKEYRFDCEEMGQVKHALDKADPHKINSQTSPGKDVLQYLNAFFKKTLTMKSDAEAAKFIARFNSCFSKDISPAKFEKALSKADSIKHPHKNEPMPEKESFNILETACAGFSVKEVLEFMKLRMAMSGLAAGGGAAAAGGTAATVSVGSTALAFLSAAVAGWMLGETIKMVDSQTVNYGYKYIGRPVSNYVIEPVVFKAMGVPSKSKQLDTEANLLSLEMLITYKEHKIKHAKHVKKIASNK